jgi:hypothetical protein
LTNGVEEAQGSGTFGLGDLVGGAFEGDEVDFGVELLQAGVLVFHEPGGTECQKRYKVLLWRRLRIAMPLRVST